MMEKLKEFLRTKKSLLVPVATFASAFFGIFLATSIVNYPEPPPNVTTMYAPAPINPYSEGVSASGIIESYGDNVTLGVSVTGLVKRIDAPVGAAVKKGDVIYQVDDRTELADVLVKREKVQVAKAELRKKESQLSRVLSIKDARAVSVEEVENKKNDVLIAEKQVALAETELIDAKVRLAKTKVLAPKDGVILKNNLRVGEYAEFSPKEPPIIMGNISTLQVRADVDEQSAFRIRPEQSAIAYIKGTNVELPITFDHFDLFVTPKLSLTSASDEKIDTRVLQVIYRLEKPTSFPVYVGQQVDVYIDAPMELP